MLQSVGLVTGHPILTSQNFRKNSWVSHSIIELFKWIYQDEVWIILKFVYIFHGWKNLAALAGSKAVQTTQNFARMFGNSPGRAVFIVVGSMEDWGKRSLRKKERKSFSPNGVHSTWSIYWCRLMSSGRWRHGYRSPTHFMKTLSFKGLSWGMTF